MPVANIVDEQKDPQVSTLAGLVAAAIRAKFGAASLVQVYEWPIKAELVPSLQFPCLAVYRTVDRLETGDSGDDFETANMRIDYYAPKTPLDRIGKRWPLLRAVVKRVRGVVHVGWHPSYMTQPAPPAEPEPIRLSDVGFETPVAITGQATYDVAPLDGVVVPYVQMTAVLRTSEPVDVSEYESDDLESIETDVTVGGEPAFTTITVDLDV